MENKEKSRLLAGIVTLLVFGFFVLIYFDTSEEVTSKYDYCESKGYSGYKDENMVAFNSNFRCARKAPREIGYEWEYSGIVDGSSI